MQEKIAEAWRLFDIGDFASSDAIYQECLRQTSSEEYDTYASILIGKL